MFSGLVFFGFYFSKNSFEIEQLCSMIALSSNLTFCQSSFSSPLAPLKIYWNLSACTRGGIVLPLFLVRLGLFETNLARLDVYSGIGASTLSIIWPMKYSLRGSLFTFYVLSL
jgi:hypothetical protein